MQKKFHRTGPEPIARNIARRIVAACAVVSLAGACNVFDRHVDAPSDHHGASGYHNTDGTQIDPSLLSVAEFYWAMWRAPRPAVSSAVGPRIPDLGYLRDNRSESAVTWIGHSTTLLQVAGLNVLTDPQFSDRASPVSWLGPKRQTPAALSIDELPAIEVVLISHDHYDHLDEASVRALATKRNPLFVVPLGLDALLREWGVTKIKALDWWQTVTVKSVSGADVEIAVVPVHHWGRRGLFDRNQRLWSGFVIKAPEFTAFFAGDTGYSTDFAAIGQKYGPFDLAILPVGCYELRWFMQPQHANPADAVQMHRDLKARRSLGVHWGTFALTTEPVDAPIVELPKALAAAHVDADAFALFELGETGIWRAPKEIDTRGQSKRNPKRQWRKGEAR